MTRRPRRFSPRKPQPFSSRSIRPKSEQFSLLHRNDPTQGQPSLSEPGGPLGAQHALADALGQFLRASDWVAGLRVLLSHPVLLTERVSKLLRDGADASRQQGNAVDEIMLLTHLIFLEDVRRRGFFRVLMDVQEKSARL